MKKYGKNLIRIIIGGALLFSLNTDNSNLLEKNYLTAEKERKEITLNAKENLEKYGITSEQKEAYGIFSKRAYNSVRPSEYNDRSQIKGNINNFLLKRNRFEYMEKLKEDYSSHSKKLVKFDKENNFKNTKKELEILDEINEKINSFSGEDDPYSEDAWLTYLGIPQKNNTFSISSEFPENEKGDIPYYYKLPKEFETELYNLIVKKDSFPIAMNEFQFSGAFGENASRARVLGNFKVDKGEDEKGKYFSYYDKYDFSLKLPILKNTKLESFIGKPFEIYNRIYYDL